MIIHAWITMLISLCLVLPLRFFEEGLVVPPFGDGGDDISVDTLGGELWTSFKKRHNKKY
jgi:hypothetical protein